MGLQVVGAAEVRKIVCGVSASRELFERAAAAGAQLVLVHHGIFWRNEPQRIDARMRGRLEALFAADMSLAGYHLALDAHPELSDSAQLAAELGVTVEGAVRDARRRRAPRRAGSRSTRSSRGSRTCSGGRRSSSPPAPTTVERIAIMSGGGGHFVLQAAAAGFDLFLTGEPTEPAQASARELGIHFVAGGHTATERRGIQALTRRIADRLRPRLGVRRGREPGLTTPSAPTCGDRRGGRGAAGAATTGCRHGCAPRPSGREDRAAGRSAAAPRSSSTR